MSSIRPFEVRNRKDFELHSVQDFEYFNVPSKKRKTNIRKIGRSGSSKEWVNNVIIKRNVQRTEFHTTSSIQERLPYGHLQYTL